MAASAVALAGFVVLERRRERAGVSPLVTPSLFRKRAFSAGLATAAVFFAGMIGIMFTFALCLQIGLHYGPAHAGLSMIAWAIGTAIGAGGAAGALAPRYGRHVLHAGVLIMLAGVLGMLAVVHGQGTGLTSLGIAGPELVAGIGMGAILAPLFDIVLAGVDDDEVGSASGTLNAMQQLGAALGIAVLGTVFFSVVGDHGFIAAFERILWIEAGVLGVVALLVLLLPMHAREPEPAGVAEPA
jgi:MFS family permease